MLRVYDRIFFRQALYVTNIARRQNLIQFLPVNIF